MATCPGRKIHSRDYSAMSLRVASLIALIWVAATAWLMRHVPHRLVRFTWRRWNFRPAAWTWSSPAASTRSTTSSCTCVSVRPPRSRPRVTASRSAPMAMAPSWAKAWALSRSSALMMRYAMATKSTASSKASAHRVMAKATRSTHPAPLVKSSASPVPTAKQASRRAPSNSSKRTAPAQKSATASRSKR